MSTITQFPSGNTRYRIEFDYLARTFVVVTLVNSSNPTMNRVLEVGRDYRFLNPTMIEMLVDQSGFDIVRIHRQTGTDLVVDFRNGSVLTASDLTNAELQSIHIAEEGRDQTVDLAKEYSDAAGRYAGNAKDSEDEARRIAENIKAAGKLGYMTRRSFEKGFNVTILNEVLLWEEDGEYYRWDGTLPKNVPAGSTPETSGGIGLGAWVSVGDASLRSDLASTQDEMLGDKLVGVKLPSYSAVPRTQHDKNAEQPTVADWGAVNGVESSAAAQAMVDETGTLIVPAGFNLVAKNINLSNAKEVFIYGKMSLPDGCVDFDRALYGYNNTRGLQVYINELDGNKAGQSGANVGTHLLYLIQCPKVNVYVKYAHSNYFSRTYTPVLSPDEFRTESAGALFFHECHYSQFIADRIENWGREGIMANKTNYSVMALGLALGDASSNGQEYSGFQFSGDYNNLLYANVENSGASGGSFDCRYSRAGTIKVIRNKYFGSVGLGHPSSPAEYNVIDCIISINSAANGLQFAANSNNNRVLSATVINPAAIGINQSDGANNNSVDNFVVKDPGTYHVAAFNSTLKLTNGDLTANANNVAKLNATGGGNFTLRNVRLDPTKQLVLSGVSGLAGNSTVTITDGNITPYSHIVLFPSNASGALANVYISTINMGSCVLNTASGTPAGSGASLRYMVI